MLIKIRETELTLGMFVESVECSSEQFQARRFLIEDMTVLEAIRRTKADYVLINSALGRSPVERCSYEYSAEAVEGVRQGTESLKSILADGLSGNIELAQADAMAQSIAELARKFPDAVAGALRLRTKDESTYVHSLSVSALMSLVAERSKLADAEVRELGVAGLLHDIGKLAIPRQLIQKPSKLTEAETRLFRTHPLRGRSILEKSRVSQLTLDVCELHHELLDGSGYPHRLFGDAISPAVRICTVCDVYDALTSQRAYKKAWSPGNALKWMAQREDKFDIRYLTALSHIVLP